MARDNLKFLATLERHFEVLGTGTLAAMADCLPALMNALRMVWIISHYYGDDEKMGALFKRIADQIGDRIEAAVSPKVREPEAAALGRNQSDNRKGMTFLSGVIGRRLAWVACLSGRGT